MKKRTFALILTTMLSLTMLSCTAAETDEPAAESASTTSESTQLDQSAETENTESDSSATEDTPTENSISESVASDSSAAESTVSESTSVEDAAIATTDTDESVDYKITYQSVTFHTDSINTIWMQAFAEITNTGNTDLYLQDGAYDLTAADGTMIHTGDYFTSYPQVISPGEKGYYYDTDMMDTGTPTDNIAITPHISADKSEVEKIQLEVSNTEIYNKEYGGVDLHGKLKNTTTSIQSDLHIAAVLLNENGQPIGLLETFLSGDVQPEAERGFELESGSLPDDFSASSVADYKVFVYPYQYQY